MDILDLLLDDDGDDTPAVKAAPAVEDDREADLELLLEEFKSGDTATSKAALRAMLSLMR